MAYGQGYGGGYGDAASSDAAVTFAGVGSFSATTTTYVFTAAVAFAAAGSFTATGGVPVFALVTFAGVGGFLPIARFTGTDYRLYVVDMAGAVYAECENARIGAVTTELNAPGSVDFTLATTDPDAVYAVPGREVQVWRGDQLLWWGPIVRPQAQLWEASWQCAGLPWYFAHRFMGRADRQNQLVNGDFEASETGWTFVNGVGHSPDVTKKVEGAKSLKLTGATADHVQYASQTWVHGGVTPEGWPGDFMTVAAYVYIPSADYHGGAIQDLGLVVVHRDAGGATVEVGAATIGDDTPKDAWIAIETGVGSVKAGETVEVQLFPPHGVAFYDLVTMTFMESLSFGALGGTVEVADIIAGIVDYAQQHPPYDWGHGKSDLNIDTNCPPTGVTVSSLAYQFAEHRNIGDALAEYVRQGIVDTDIALTPTTRTYTTYAPRKGAWRADLLLELDTNIADFTWSWDGESAATNVVVLGPGDGPDRPEGGAIADTTFLDGLTLEWVESAPDDLGVGQLDDRAGERLAIAIHPEIIEVTTLPGVGIIGQIQTGDTVPVNIQHGFVDIDHEPYRAVRISIDPHTDQARITLNRQ